MYSCGMRMSYMYMYDKPREGPIDDRALPPQGGAEPRVRGVCASFPHINTLDDLPDAKKRA